MYLEPAWVTERIWLLAESDRPNAVLSELTVENSRGSDEDRREMERFHNNSDQWITISSSRANSGLSMVFEYLNGWLRLAKEKVDQIRFRATKERRRLREAVREREASLANLLADSSEAIVVTDDTHRLLATNRAALDLFGVSSKNKNRFTIDAFLPSRKLPLLQGHTLPFVRGAERWGKCEIRRLDGSLRVVEFAFQANFTLGRHLARFRDVTRHEQAQLKL